MVIAGLVAGSITASTAFRSDPAGEVAAAPPPPAPAVAPMPAPVVGSVRVGESAIAEWEYRRTGVAPKASRGVAAGSMVRPAAGPRTGWFGEGRRSHRHTGIDFDGNTGDRVVAAAAGEVVHAGNAPSGYSGYGRMVLIDHGGGITTLYAHLSRLSVSVGDRVVPGEAIGAIGTSGNVTGSHLHFEVRVGGVPVNPANWVPS